MSRTDLRNLIVQNFNSDEIKQLCFDLNIDDESLPDETKLQLVMGLVEFCEDHGLLQDLITLCSSRRPHLDWPAPYDPTLLVGEFPEDDESPTTRDRFLQVGKYQLAILLAVPVLLIAAIAIVLTVPHDDESGGDVPATSAAADDLDTPAPATAELKVGVAQTNVYEGPGANYEQLGMIERNAVYRVLGRNGDSSWWQVDYGGTDGWVEDSAVERIDDLPVAVADIPLPPPEAIFDASPRHGTAPLRVTFTNNSVGTTFEWDFGDGGSSTEREPRHTYEQAGRYTVSLTVRNGEGRDTEQKQNFVEVGQQTPLAAFSAWPLSGDAPLTVQFENQSGNATSYSWDFGDSGSPADSSPNPSHTYNQPGVYNVVLVARNDDGEDTERKQAFITVEVPLPVADFADEPTIGRAPFTVQFYYRSEGSPDQFYWDFGDGRTSNERNPSHTYHVEGVYDVTLTVTNERGADTKTKRAYVTLTEPECMDTIDISDETPDGFCPTGFLMTGVTCSGEYCDNKSLHCCRVSDNKVVFESELTRAISEERGRNEYWTNTGFVYGIQCEHEFCDNIQFFVSHIPFLTNTGSCGYIKEASEESDRQNRACLPGYFVAGARCSGEYCDNISLRCCRAQ